jgi:hypothetical protein
VLEKTKSAYLLWYNYYQVIPKTHRYSLAEKIDKIFIDTIESIVTANFLSPKEKEPYVRFAIKKLDTLKIFLMMLWETKSLNDKKYIALSERLNEIGRNLGGWRGKILKDLEKQNSLKK